MLEKSRKAIIAEYWFKVAKYIEHEETLRVNDNFGNS